MQLRTLFADEAGSLWTSDRELVVGFPDRYPIFGKSQCFPVEKPLPAKVQLVEGRALLRSLKQLLKSRSASLARAEPGSELFELREKAVEEVTRAIERVKEEVA